MSRSLIVGIFPFVLVDFWISLDKNVHCATLEDCFWSLCKYIAECFAGKCITSPLLHFASLFSALFCLLLRFNLTEFFYSFIKSLFSNFCLKWICLLRRLSILLRLTLKLDWVSSLDLKAWLSFKSLPFCSWRY